MSKRLAVLGSPIEHSKSPQIQLAALRQLGVSATFERIEVTDLAKFLIAADDFDALSLTMPLKEQALAVADWVDPIAIRTNSANYLLKADGTWKAFNTDVFGIQRAVAEVAAESVGVLGTGATARSALAAMSGKQMLLWGRNTAMAQSLARDFGPTVSDLDSVLNCDLVISTLPGEALSDLVSANFPGVLLDVVYSRPSPKGFTGYISGVQMLIWQAIGQLRLLINASDKPLDGEEELAEAMLKATRLAE